MRLLGTLFAWLTMLCVFCAPVLAQSAPSTCQYRQGACPSGATVQSLGDGADAFSENAGRGADAVNDAMEGPEASAPAASSDASPPAGSASPERGSAGGDLEGPGGEITTLPETGGASLAALGFGALLVAFGLAARGLTVR